MIEEVDVKPDEIGYKKILFSFLAFLKRDWSRILVTIVTFAIVSSIIYFRANTTSLITTYSVNEYEVGQIADKNIVATKSMNPTSEYPISLEEGEKIIKKGFPVTEEALIKLKKMADAPASIDYRSIGNSNFFLILIAALWIILFSPIILGKRVEIKELILESILFILAYFLTSFAYKSVVFQSVYRISVVIPSALSLFLIAILFGQRSAFLYSFILAFGILDASDFEIVPTIFTLATGLSSARIVRKIEKRIDIIFASILQAVLSIVFIVVLKVIFNDKFSDIAIIIVGVAVNGFMSGILVLGLLTPLEYLLNTTSVFRLMDLGDTNSKLLQKLLISASGTYSHSMMVAQLAENACKKIGANHLVARVAAYYHDIGKIDHPEYFKENQSGENIHDTLDPKVSASYLRGHVEKSIEYAKKYHLPKQIVDIIAEHHGNSLMASFYGKAIQNAPENTVSESDFMYPGNPPISKESAVVMLADTIEAACRTVDNPTPERLEKSIQDFINGKINGHQLEKSALTFGDITLIKESFLQILIGYYHSRIKYPNQKDPDDVSENENQSKVALVENKTTESVKSEASDNVQEEKIEIKENITQEESLESENAKIEDTESDKNEQNENVQEYSFEQPEESVETKEESEEKKENE